jgi:adenylate cyclase
MRGRIAAMLRLSSMAEWYRARLGARPRLDWQPGAGSAMAGNWLAKSKQGMAELRRRRVLRALGAYVLGGWVLLQVANTVADPLGIALWAQKALIYAVVIGIVPAAILAWVYDLTRHGVVRTPDGEARGLDGSGAPPAMLAGDAAGGEPVSRIASIAVLPFADLSQAQDHGWFCDGLAEEILDSLCCVRGLRVASRGAAFQFRGGHVDPREVGAKLHVDAVLEGSVRVAGQRLRVIAQLVDAHSGYQSWSETYEREVADVFAIQREIAENVTRALKLSLRENAAFRGEKYAPRNMEAYEHYVRGRQLTGQFSQNTIMQAPQQFRRAIELDPQYAQAYAGLADALAQQAQWRFAPAAQVMAEGTVAANRALDLAPDMAEAHMAQGHLRSVAGDADGARRAFERALELNPGLFDAWHYYARDCYSRGEYARAAELFQRAHRVRPDDFTPLIFAASSLRALGDEEGARKLTARASAGLLRQCEMEPDNLRAHYLAGGALLQAGRKEEGRRLTQRALAMAPDDFSALYNAACFHALAGEPEPALDLLERALAKGGGFPDWLRHDTDFDSLRSHPRFQALLARFCMNPAAAG